jgi:hypothetical protein
MRLEEAAAPSSAPAASSEPTRSISPEKLTLPANCRDVTSEQLDKMFAIIGAPKVFSLADGATAVHLHKQEMRR